MFNSQTECRYCLTLPKFQFNFIDFPKFIGNSRYQGKKRSYQQLSRTILKVVTSESRIQAVKIYDDARINSP